MHPLRPFPRSFLLLARLFETIDARNRRPCPSSPRRIPDEPEHDPPRTLLFIAYARAPYGNKRVLTVSPASLRSLDRASQHSPMESIGCSASWQMTRTTAVYQREKERERKLAPQRTHSHCQRQPTRMSLRRIYFGWFKSRWISATSALRQPTDYHITNVTLGPLWHEIPRPSINLPTIRNIVSWRVRYTIDSIGRINRLPVSCRDTPQNSKSVVRNLPDQIRNERSD